MLSPDAWSFENNYIETVMRMSMMRWNHVTITVSSFVEHWTGMQCAVVMHPAEPRFCTVLAGQLVVVVYLAIA
jgi:hypothetical protein